MDYQQQLREVASAGGLTQEALARRLGVSLVTVNTWINGHTKPRAQSLRAIEELHGETLGVPMLSSGQVSEAVAVAERLQMEPVALVKDTARVERLTLHLTYHTNSIEGSTMTLTDTREVLFANRALVNRTQVEQAEARNHQAALLWLLPQVVERDFRFTEDLVRSLHVRLMNGIAHDAGVWRAQNARIAGSRVVLANPVSVPSLMGELIDELASAERGPRALATLHARFEQIHPFSDGNGRIGRLLMLAMALRTQLPPPLVMRERKYAYYRYLEAAQAGEDANPLTFFIARAMVSAHDLLANPKGRGED